MSGNIESTYISLFDGGKGQQRRERNLDDLLICAKPLKQDHHFNLKLHRTPSVMSSPKELRISIPCHGKQKSLPAWNCDSFPEREFVPESRQEMTGFKGGLNQGIWIVSDYSQKLVLKQTRRTRFRTVVAV